MKQWLITAGGDPVALEGDVIEFVLARPGLFGLTADDCAFVRKMMATGSDDVWYAFLSRILMVGIAVECSMGVVGPDGRDVPGKVARRGWKHIGSSSPPSQLERGQKLQDEDDPTMLIDHTDLGEVHVVFHRESHPMWMRLIKWIENTPVELGINAKTVVALKEWDTQRAWCQTFESIVKEYQFSENPSRGGKCNRCGWMVSWDEMVAGVDASGSAICPKCGMPLA